MQCEVDVEKCPSTKKDTATMIAQYTLDENKQGKKTNECIQGFLCTLCIMGGESIYNFLHLNLNQNLPHEGTVRRWTTDSQLKPFLSGVHRRNFEIVRDLYKALMELKGHPGADSVPPC